jgi:hypothetical protein
MPEVIEQRTPISAKQILENLRDLRHFDGDEQVFWRDCSIALRCCVRRLW